MDDTVVGFNGAIIRRADPSVAVLFVPDLMEAVCDPNRPDKNRECAFDLIEEWDIAWVGTVYHDALLDAVSTRKPELEAFLGVQEERHQQHLALRPGVLALVPEDMTELRKIVQAPPERRGAWWEPSTATSWYRVNRDDGTTFDLDKPERKDLIRRLHAAAAEAVGDGRQATPHSVTAETPASPALAHCACSAVPVLGDVWDTVV